MAHYFGAGYAANDILDAPPYFDCGSKFVCGSTCCTIRPTAPAHGVGVYNGFAAPPLPGYPPPQPGGWPTPSCSGGIDYGSAYGGYTAANRGPAGWAEVGWLAAIERRPRPHHSGHRERRRRPSCERNVENRPGPRGRRFDRKTAGWQPRAEYRYDCSDVEPFEHDYNEDILTVGCRVRRYRLYARPAYGWCGSFNVSQFQYAVTDESVPRCDAIFIVLRDDPRADSKRRYGGVPYQPLESGDLVLVPGEPNLFRVHLYSDDRVY